MPEMRESGSREALEVPKRGYMAIAGDVFMRLVRKTGVREALDGD